MTNRITSVMGRMRLNAAIPASGSSAMRISSVPYADDEMPSGESTPSASGLDSRCSPSCSLTSGGPSSRRFTEYQKPSVRSGPRSRTSTALRMAGSAPFFSAL